MHSEILHRDGNWVKFVTLLKPWPESTLEIFRWVVGLIITSKEALSLGDAGALLDLRLSSTSDPVDILHFVTTKLHTVLVAETGEITNDMIPQLHQSFVDFITSRSASGRFCIDVRAVDAQIGVKCLRLVQRLRNNDDGDRSKIPLSCIRYAAHNWMRHLADGPSGVAIFGDDKLVIPPLKGHPDDNRLIAESWERAVCNWFKVPMEEYEGRMSIIRLAPHSPDPTCYIYSPDRTFYAAFMKDARVALWNVADSRLLWASDPSFHLIQLIRLSQNRLVVSSPDGTVWSWDLVQGKPTHHKPSMSGPQLGKMYEQINTPIDDPIVRWIPFEVDAGSWAYIDSTLIRAGDEYVFFIDVKDIAQ